MLQLQLRVKVRLLGARRGESRIRRCCCGEEEGIHRRPGVMGQGRLGLGMGEWSICAGSKGGGEVGGKFGGEDCGGGGGDEILGCESGNEGVFESCPWVDGQYHAR